MDMLLIGDAGYWMGDTGSGIAHRNFCNGEMRDGIIPAFQSFSFA